MPEGPDGKTIIIVKKVSGHGGAHGGAWKVAYADFVTAMMALFMVLWLVNSAAQPTRQRIASYFRKPGIFQKGSGTPMEMGGGGILPDAFSPPSDGNAQIEASERIYDVEAQTGRVRDLYDPGQGSKEFHYAPKLQGKSEKGVTKDDVYEQQSGENSKEVAAEEKLQELKTEIEKAIEEKRGSPSSEGVLGDIEIKVDQRGLVIEIMDTEKSSMFASGQAVINNKAQSKLVEIGKILSKVSNPIDIEGHTDGNPFKSSRSRQYDNWNLSTDRANTARRVLESSGFEKGQIARVVGYADARPKDTSNPLNPANRRITISMRYSGRAKVELDGKQVYETSTNKPKVLISPSKKDVQKPVDATVSPNNAGNAVVDPVEQSANAQDVNKLTEMDQGLNVEVSTVVPEGAQVVQEEQGYVADQEKKTLIFENPDAFFKK